MGWGSGHSSLDNFVLLIEIRGPIGVVRDFNSLICPINEGVGLLQPGVSQDDILISTVDDVEENSVNNVFYLDKHGGDVLDDPCTIVGTINVLGTNGGWKVVAGEVMSSDKSPIKAID